MKYVTMNLHKTPGILAWVLILTVGCGPGNEKNTSDGQGTNPEAGIEESMNAGYDDSDEEEKMVPEGAALTDGQWKLIRLGGEAVDPESGRKSAFLVFDKENSRFGGNNSCNDISGNYSLKKGNRIAFSEIITTQMACMPNEIELPFMEVLDRADNYTIKGDTLFLNKARMAPLAVFALSKKEQ